MLQNLKECCEHGFEGKSIHCGFPDVRWVLLTSRSPAESSMFTSARIHMCSWHALKCKVCQRIDITVCVLHVILLPSCKVLVLMPCSAKKDPTKMADWVGGWFKG